METGFPEEEKTGQKKSFDEFPDETRINVFQQLKPEERGKFKCVSKDWRRLIAIACFPKYYGLLIKFESRDGPDSELNRMSYEPLSGIFSWHNSIRLDFKNLGLELLESCNGLLLLCRSVPTESLRTRRMYGYYVVNPLTKRHVVVRIPEPMSSMYKYAALVYHPAESSHFKIVRFCIDYLHIYSSESGRWSHSRIVLKDHKVSRAKWARQSVYLKGAIYRLSMSGHVLRIDVNQKTGEPWTVEVIEIPGTSAKMKEAACIGVSNDHIRFAMNDGSTLEIWELNRQSSGWRWSLKLRCLTDLISEVYRHPRPLCFLPHSDAIVLEYDLQSSSSFVILNCLRYSESEDMSLGPHLQSSVRCIMSPWRGARKFVFPLFQCEATFA